MRQVGNPQHHGATFLVRASPTVIPSQPSAETIAIDSTITTIEPRGVIHTSSHRSKRPVPKTLHAPTAIPLSNPAPEIAAWIKGRSESAFLLTISGTPAFDRVGHMSF